MDYAKIMNYRLFKDMTEEEIEKAINNLNGKINKYLKNEYVLLSGDKADNIGIILDGSVRIENNDIWGNRTIIGHAGVGEIFAKSYALGNEKLLVDVVCNENSQILFLNVKALRTLSDIWAIKLIKNLLLILSIKNFNLSNRSFYISYKKVRNRVLAYLNNYSLKVGSKDFLIPFNREELADYLNLDRTALSKELSDMKKDGLIDYRKNHFIIKEK